MSSPRDCASSLPASPTGAPRQWSSTTTRTAGPGASRSMPSAGGRSPSMHGPTGSEAGAPNWQRRSTRARTCRSTSSRALSSWRRPRIASVLATRGASSRSGPQGSVRHPARGARARDGLDLELLALMVQHLAPDDLTSYDRELRVWVDRERARFAAWYEMFPRSQSGDASRHGTFADAERALARVAELGFDVVYLPPIHPV